MFGPLLGRSLLFTTQRLRNFRSLDVLAKIQDEPFVPPEQVERRQFQRLQKLLRRAETLVPYYRKLFHSLGITSADVRNWSDFARLPVLTKDIIRANQLDLIREDVAIETLQPHHSGGSTGIPLSFYREQEYMVASEAGTFRNMLVCGWKPGEMVGFFWGSNERINKMSRAEFEVRQILRRTYLFDPFQSGAEDMDRWLKRWKTLGASVILGYSSTIARFAQHIKDSGARVAPLRGVFTTAEKLYPEQRAIISQVFSCHVYDCYGSSEVQNIAAECPRGKMHINCDYVVLELDEPAAKPGAPAPFLVTSLLNKAMPFIRYRNEDCGALDDARCDCGNHFPLMKLEIARVSDNFTMADGRVVHGEFFTHLMYGSEGIATFQFHQTAPDEIVLWVVPGPGLAERRERSIKSAITQLHELGSREHPIRVEVRESEAIPLSAAGKHRFTRSDVKPT
jgi:phenylacetate-CoA ligase